MDTHSKITQIFKYIQAIDEMRNPIRIRIDQHPWSLWTKDIPENHHIQFSDTLQMRTSEIFEETFENEEFIIRISRPSISPCPNPPKEVLEWLTGDWREVDAKINIIDEKTIKDELGDEQTIRFEDDNLRKELYEKWSRLRGEWINLVKPDWLVLKVFEKLYSLHSFMERESEQVELMIGDGVLAIDSAYHPIIAQRIELQFNSSIPEFTLVRSDQPPELYIPLLRIINSLPPNALSKLIKEMDQQNYLPLGGTDLSDYLMRIITQISPYGQLVERAESIESDQPRIFRLPVFFLRRRTHGFTVAIEHILKDLEQTNHLPNALTKIINANTDLDHEAHAVIQNPNDWQVINGEDESVLLSKESNAEQLQIAQRLEREGAVLVQGPPGTGKTHTIANLLGHLLAQGKTVLVTSHTAKALTVLRDKVVEPLQPLCVSVLDRDSENRRQMESSIDTIAEKLSSLDPVILDNKASILTQNRMELLTKIKTLRNHLLLARQDEYRPIVFAGESFDPSQAARKVSKEKDILNWIPQGITLGAPLSLSLEEILDLYASNKKISQIDEKNVSDGFVHPNLLIEPIEFEKLVDEIHLLEQSNLQHYKNLWNERILRNTEHLEDLWQRLRTTLDILGDGDQWHLCVIDAGKREDIHRQPWIELIEIINNTNQQIAEASIHTARHEVAIDSTLPLEQGLTIVKDIIAYLDTGKKLGRFNLMFKSSWQSFLKQTKIDGKMPENKEHFVAIHAQIEILFLRQNLLDRWQRQITKLGGPTPEQLGLEPERICANFAERLWQFLNWNTDMWEPLQQTFKEIGFSFEGFLEAPSDLLSVHGELLVLQNLKETLKEAFDSEIRRVRLANARDRLQQIWEILQESQVKNPGSKLLHDYSNAVKRMDIEEYQQLFKKFLSLSQLQSIVQIRWDQLKKLEAVAPAWAAAIKQRDGIHGLPTPPGDPILAWQWRQIHDELEQRGKISMQEIQDQISTMTRQLQEITAKLIEIKAWSAQVQRTNEEQRRALLGWKQLMKKIGKGTGIRVPRLLSDARKLMPQCQTAVPVWVMPLSRVVENFVPGKNRFDVLVIDEASQADIMAITALYYADQVLIVGDDEQVSPESIGERLDETQRLIDTYLKGVPNANLYDGRSSIYDIVKTCYNEVRLREHFRCVAPIIQFSNRLSYDGEIKPLRDASEVKRKPHTVAYRVQGIAEKKINLIEAYTIASLILASTEHKDYHDATFGVISLLADQQANVIDNLLRKYMPPTEYQRRKIRCGNAAQFQGDERDVMFLSMVYSPNGEGPLRMLSDPSNSMRKRYNVATSRARDQLWVIHSVDPDIDLKEGDLRKELILHAQDPYRYEDAVASLSKESESEFEKQVLRRLIERNYKVTPQWRVGGYRIDLVVEGNGKRLAIECDGDRWHPIDKLDEDMSRQAILERLGWKFVRIRGSQFFCDPEKSMESVFSRLDSLGISPEGINTREATKENFNVNEEIIRRAAEIRREWFDGSSIQDVRSHLVYQ